MRLFSIFLVLVLSTPAWSADQKCEAEAIQLVTDLESVLSKIIGGIQGDNIEDNISAVVTDSKDESYVEFSVSAAHSNEDLEAWTQEYQVRYEIYDGNCYLQTYQYLGAQD